jgi:hypothetical protein
VTDGVAVWKRDDRTRLHDQHLRHELAPLLIHHGLAGRVSRRGMRRIGRFGDEDDVRNSVPFAIDDSQVEAGSRTHAGD